MVDWNGIREREGEIEVLRRLTLTIDQAFWALDGTGEVAKAQTEARESLHRAIRLRMQEAKIG